jgi:hypothetical protein
MPAQRRGLNDKVLENTVKSPSLRCIERTWKSSRLELSHRMKNWTTLRTAGLSSGSTAELTLVTSYVVDDAATLCREGCRDPRAPPGCRASCRGDRQTRQGEACPPSVREPLALQGDQRRIYVRRCCPELQAQPIPPWGSGANGFEEHRI